ncbi:MULTISPECIES: hypothetical protein, partial [Pseudanabaena]
LKEIRFNLINKDVNLKEMRGNNDVLGINTQQWIVDPLPVNISTSDTYGLGMQPTGSQQMPSIALCLIAVICLIKKLHFWQMGFIVVLHYNS